MLVYGSSSLYIYNSPKTSILPTNAYWKEKTHTRKTLLPVKNSYKEELVCNTNKIYPEKITENINILTTICLYILRKTNTLKEIIFSNKLLGCLILPVYFSTPVRHDGSYRYFRHLGLAVHSWLNMSSGIIIKRYNFHRITILWVLGILGV